MIRRFAGAALFVMAGVVSIGVVQTAEQPSSAAPSEYRVQLRGPVLDAWKTELADEWRRAAGLPARLRVPRAREPGGRGAPAAVAVRRVGDAVRPGQQTGPPPGAKWPAPVPDPARWRRRRRRGASGAGLRRSAGRAPRAIARDHRRRRRAARCRVATGRGGGHRKLPAAHQAQRVRRRRDPRAAISPTPTASTARRRPSASPTRASARARRPAPTPTFRRAASRRSSTGPARLISVSRRSSTTARRTSIRVTARMSRRPPSARATRRASAAARRRPRGSCSRHSRTTPCRRCCAA